MVKSLKPSKWYLTPVSLLLLCRAINVLKESRELPEERENNPDSRVFFWPPSLQWICFYHQIRKKLIVTRRELVQPSASPSPLLHYLLQAQVWGVEPSGLPRTRSEVPQLAWPRVRPVVRDLCNLYQQNRHKVCTMTSTLEILSREPGFKVHRKLTVRPLGVKLWIHSIILDRV